MKATDLWSCQIERVSQRVCLWGDMSALSTINHPSRANYCEHRERKTDTKRDRERERARWRARAFCSLLGHCDPVNNLPASSTAVRLGNFSLRPKRPGGGPLTANIIRGRQTANVPEGAMETHREIETDKMHFSSQCLTVYILVIDLNTWKGNREGMQVSRYGGDHSCVHNLFWKFTSFFFFCP